MAGTDSIFCPMTYKKLQPDKYIYKKRLNIKAFFIWLTKAYSSSFNETITEFLFPVTTTGYNFPLKPKRIDKCNRIIPTIFYRIFWCKSSRLRDVNTISKGISVVLYGIVFPAILKRVYVILIFPVPLLITKCTIRIFLYYSSALSVSLTTSPCRLNSNSTIHPPDLFPVGTYSAPCLQRFPGLYAVLPMVYCCFACTAIWIAYRLTMP